MQCAPVAPILGGGAERGGSLGLAGQAVEPQTPRETEAQLVPRTKVENFSFRGVVDLQGMARPKSPGYFTSCLSTLNLVQP